MANPARQLYTALKFPAQLVIGGGMIAAGQISAYPHCGANYHDRGKVTVGGAGTQNLLRAGWLQPIRLYRIHFEWVGGQNPETARIQYSTGEILWEASRGGSGGAGGAGVMWGELTLDFAPFGISAPQLTSTQLVFSNPGALSIDISWNIMYCLDNQTTAND